MRHHRNHRRARDAVQAGGDGRSARRKRAARPIVEMVATDFVADVRIPTLVRFSVELSEKLPVAMNSGGTDR